jgi:hypothetical protein
MTSVYSFGADSPLKFRISDKMASHYNEAVDQFLKAQRRFTQKFGRQWDPAKEPIKIKWSKNQRKAWNDFNKIFSDAVNTVGQYVPNDLMDDYLVKNAGSAIAVGADRWGRIIYTAAVLGAVYGYLRGLQGVSRT